MTALYLPEPLPHQIPVLDGVSNRKLWRAGRRTGKTRAALLAAVDGHGPRDADGAPLHKGMLQGAHIVWLAPDYPQSNAIWREEVLPRFEGVAGADINKVDRRVTLQGLGSLTLRSAESIDSVRGFGFSGAIVDEGAYQDLEYVLGAVLLPALLDRRGWLFVISSPNGGHDGNSAKRVPSYFNLLAEEIERGARAGWQAWHNRTEDNPALAPDALAALRAEYPEGSLTAQQELDALLVAGGGRFYPELLEPDAVQWVTEPPVLPEWASYWGSYDWGYGHPACFMQFARQGATLYLLDTLYLHKRQDEEQAAEIKGWARPECLRDVFAGHDAWAERKAHSAAAESVADIFDRYGIGLVRANIDRRAGAKAVRRLFHAGHPVQLKVVDTPSNRRVLDELVKLIPDPLNLDVPSKRDANERGLNGDDGADAFRYGVASPSLETMEPVRVERVANVTDGRDEAGEDPFTPSMDRNRFGFGTEYSERPDGPEGQFGW